MAILVRFVVLYFVLYMFPFPLTAFAGLADPFPPPFKWIGQAAAYLSGFNDQAQSAAAIWVGENVLRLGKGAIVIQPTGSGDTLSSYVDVFCYFILALTGTIAWTLIERGRPVSPRVTAAFRTYLRFAMAMILLSYGFAKVPPSQFQTPGPDLLIRTYGDSSPMGLLWTFMGFSTAYTMFAGFAEIIPGLLLLFERTVTLGALMGAATMTNVVALNLAYDVPVKQFSMHLLAALVILVIPDLPKLINVLVLHRSVEAPAPPASEPGARRRMWAVARAVLAVTIVAGGMGQAYSGWYSFGSGAPAYALAGVYDVEAFVVNGEARLPLWTDETRWWRFMVSRRGTRATLQRMGGKNEPLFLTHDEKAGTFVLKPLGPEESFTLKVVKPDDTHLVLEGPFRGAQLRVELTKATNLQFPINSRGFSWIQELPYNR